jgi:hypothetical protein
LGSLEKRRPDAFSTQESKRTDAIIGNMSGQ